MPDIDMTRPAPTIGIIATEVLVATNTETDEPAVIVNAVTHLLASDTDVAATAVIDGTEYLAHGLLLSPYEAQTLGVELICAAWEANGVPEEAIDAFVKGFAE